MKMSQRFFIGLAWVGLGLMSVSASADTLQLQRSTDSGFAHHLVAYRLLPAAGSTRAGNRR